MKITTPFLVLIRIWQRYISPGLAPRCKYYPSCSHYTYQAIQEYKLIGILLGAWRVIRCNPWSHGGVDYPPKIIVFKKITIRSHSEKITNKGAF